MRCGRSAGGAIEIAAYIAVQVRPTEVMHERRRHLRNSDYLAGAISNTKLGSP